MRVQLGRKESQKTLAMQRCFRDGMDIQRLYSGIQTAVDSIRAQQPRLASNMLSEIRWHGIDPMLAMNRNLPELEKKSLRRLRKEVEGARTLINEKSNQLQPLDEREKEEWQKRIDHIRFIVQQHAGYSQERCGGSPGWK